MSQNKFLFFLLLVIFGLLSCSDNEEPDPEVELSGFFVEMTINSEKIIIKDSAEATHRTQTGSSSNLTRLTERSATGIFEDESIDYSITFNEESSDSESLVGLAARVILSDSIPYARTGERLATFVAAKTLGHFVKGVRMDFLDENGKLWSTAVGVQPEESTFKIVNDRFIRGFGTGGGDYNFIIEATFNCTFFDDEGNTLVAEDGRINVGIW